MTISINLFLLCFIVLFLALPASSTDTPKKKTPKPRLEHSMNVPPFVNSRPTAHLLSPRYDESRPAESSNSYFPSGSTSQPQRQSQQQQLHASPQSPSTPRSPYTHSTMARDADTRPFLTRHVTHHSPSNSMNQGGMLSPSVAPMHSPAYQQSPPQIVTRRRLPSSPASIQRPIRSAPEVATNAAPKQIVCPICMLHFSRVELLQAHLNIHR